MPRQTPVIYRPDGVPGRSLRPAAFTLIELLVVIAVLGVLASLLLPALSKAKAKASGVDCLNRQRQWITAMGMFVDDNEGWIPRESYEPLGEVTINNWAQVKGRTLPDGTVDSHDVWYNCLPSYLNQMPAYTYSQPSQRKEFYNRDNLLQCSSAKFPSYAYRPTFQFPLFSMAMNSQLIQSGPTIKFSDIESYDPSRTALFLDNRLEGEAKVHNAQDDTHLGQPAAYANRFSARHYGGGNIAFADSHVEWLPGRRVVETRDNSPLVGGPIVPPVDVIWEIYPQ